MDIKNFIKQRPYLYHLTDRENLKFIKASGMLYSTKALIEQSSGTTDSDTFLRSRRPEHVKIQLSGHEIYIRDQRPLNKALDKCLTDGWTREDFIYHLNKRVFLWPTLKRLNIHFGRYASEKPIILSFNTSDIISLNNPNIEITNLNSGATRPLGSLGGKAPARGINTFKPFSNYTNTIGSVAEFTVVDKCILPKTFEIADDPNGTWNIINI